MKLFERKDADYEPADKDHFSGEVSVVRVLQTDTPEPVRLYRVCFQPGGRTDWHLHTGVQLLLVEEGKGRVQKEGEEILEIGPGDAVYVGPGEKHWHGASSEEPMTHLAVNVGGGTEWMEKVTDQEYSPKERGGPAQISLT
ncbi:cupin domain-containing protein [Acidobacteria bacterium AH-259-D05]|nr:cupin domain-containing protein [Acidobacteria bacterium AH-259-D05]